MYQAVITNVEKRDDEILFTVNFVDDGTSFGRGDSLLPVAEVRQFQKQYRIVNVHDVSYQFDQTVAAELRRINTLYDNYLTLKAREGEIIVDRQD